MTFFAPAPRPCTRRRRATLALTLAACASCVDVPQPTYEQAIAAHAARVRAGVATRETSPGLRVELAEDLDTAISVVAPLDARAWAPDPAAPTPSAVTAAQALFAQGIDAGHHRDWARAASAFAEAYRVAPEPTTLLQLALAYRNAGHPGPALAVAAALRREVARDPSTATPDIALDRLEVALWASAATVRVVPEPSLGPVRASIDGVPAALGPAIPLDPGRHVVLIEQPGVPVFTRAFVAQAGARYLMRVEGP